MECLRGFHLAFSTVKALSHRPKDKCGDYSNFQVHQFKLDIQRLGKWALDVSTNIV